MKYATKNSINKSFHIEIHSSISEAKKAANGGQIVPVSESLEPNVQGIIDLFDNSEESDIK